jgi:hypothetical protein
MRDKSSHPQRASAGREVAYPVEQVWSAMATLLPYCSVCDVSVVVDGPGDLEVGTKFRAFSGRAGQTDGIAPAEGGMAGEIVDWSPQQTVVTRLDATNETVVVRVDMAPASPGTTLVTISVEVTPHLRSRMAAIMSRSSYARMARRTVEGEIEKLPAHLALLEEPEG